MTAVKVDQNEFERITRMDAISVVDFYADWCGPCKQFAPIFEKVSEENSDIYFLKVDTDAEVELSAMYEISSIPTIMVVRNGHIIFKQSGALPRTSLEHLVRSVRELDMDEVRNSKVN